MNEVLTIIQQPLDVDVHPETSRYGDSHGQNDLPELLAVTHAGECLIGLFQWK